MFSTISVFFASKIIGLIEKFIFFPKLEKAIEDLRNIKMVIDIGSNKGQSIKFFLKNFPESSIIGFEPNDKLNKYLNYYSLSERCKVYNLGLSNFTGNLTFYEHILDETSSFSKPQLGSRWGKLKQIVLMSKSKNLVKESNKPVITLDEFCKDNDINQIDYLKIDVEGHELNVLQGADFLLKNGYIRYIQLENQKNDLHEDNFKKIFMLLLSYNYIKLTEISHGFGNIHDVLFSRQ